jgi:alpha-D-ribose 1-methylphosphonate 5-triphosphate synthase subunit PhnG
MTPDPEERADWLAVLARAPHDALQAVARRALEDHAFVWLRAPETGLAMLRGRIGNAGDRFNLGEATLTRCVARHVDGGAAGVGYVLGRDVERASWVARLDALLQQPAHHAALMRDVVEPLRAAAREAHERERARAEASRVRFFIPQQENGA